LPQTEEDFNEATTRRRLERIVRREGTRQERNPGALAENRSPGTRARPTNYPLAATEATASGATKASVSRPLSPKRTTATYATCERALQSNQRDNVPTNQPKSMPTEADELPLRKAQLQNAFHRLTPELSRAERGGWEPVLPACPQVSTKPRNGVGLNDLLGGKDPSAAELRTCWPNIEARPHERAQQTCSRPYPKQ
jgi:hypothetical protein